MRRHYAAQPRAAAVVCLEALDKAEAGGKVATVVMGAQVLADWEGLAAQAALRS